MIEAVDEVPLKVEESTNCKQIPLIVRRKLGKLGTLSTIHSQHPSNQPSANTSPMPRSNFSPFLRSNFSPVSKGIFLPIASEVYVGHKTPTPILRHDPENIRINIKAPSPTRAELQFIRLDETKTFSNLEKYPQTLRVQEPDLNMLATPKSTRNFGPVMHYIIEALGSGGDSSYLGSLQRHLKRDPKKSLDNSNIDFKALSEEIRSMNYVDFKHKYASSASGVSMISEYLSTCVKEQGIMIGELVKHDFEFLLSQRYGHLLIKSLIGIHQELTDRALDYCVRKFCILAADEFACKVMQRLVEESSLLRLYALKRFSKNSSLWLRNVGGLFVLTTCMKCSQVHEYQYVLDLLLKNPKKLVASKLMKRALVSVVEACPIKELDFIFELLHFDQNFIRYLDNKFMTYIMIAYLRRVYKPAIDMMVRHITTDFSELLSTRYFKLLANKLVSVGSDPVLEAINCSLLSIPSKVLFDLCDGGKKVSNLHYYVFLVFASFSTDNLDTKRFTEFASRLSANPFVSQMDKELAKILTDCLQTVYSIANNV